MISKRERKDVLQISSAHPLDRFLWPEVTVCCSADRTIRLPTAEIVKSQRRQRWWWSSRSSVKSVVNCAKRGDPFSGFSLAPKLLFNTTPTATFKLKPCGVEGAEQSITKGIRILLLLLIFFFCWFWFCTTFLQSTKAAPSNRHNRPISGRRSPVNLKRYCQQHPYHHRPQHQSHFN